MEKRLESYLEIPLSQCDDYFSRVMITVEKMLTASAEEPLGKGLFLHKSYREINIM